MKIKIMKIVACAGLLLLARAVVAAPSVPAALNYQGRLQPDQGALAAGPYGLQFRFWSAATGGTQLWARAFSSVYVAANGVFNATLTDAGTELLTPPQTSDLLGAFASGPVYLGITVVQTPSGAVPSPLQITPVRQFLSVPYSLTAHWSEDAHNLINATNLLSRSGNWPPDSIYAFGLNPGSSGTASPLDGVLNARSTGLRTGVPVSFNGVLQVPELVASCLTNGSIAFVGPVRLLPPAGQPIQTIPYVGSGYMPLLLFQVPQDGLFSFTLPVPGGTISQDFTVQYGTESLTLHMAAVGGGGTQAVRFIPVKAGQSLKISVYTESQGTFGGVVTYQFLPFGVAL